MSRNDIRLRRRMMTSRRIDRHKDYGSLMGKFNRAKAYRRSLKWLGLILVFLLLFYILFFIV